ncbi:ATP-binding protein [Celerinatantimonas sp. YJH-8]|uniref:PAS domain-containing sensor histidine kinase n=1 Tax=Celerinatantimonas sp. YJH-8 TaxID=3228714 RepID=UPI0038CABD63
MHEGHLELSPRGNAAITTYHLLGASILVLVTTLAIISGQYQQTKQAIDSDLRLIRHSFIKPLATALASDQHQQLYTLAKLIITQPHIHTVMIDQISPTQSRTVLAMGHKEANDQRLHYPLIENKQLIGQLYLSVDPAFNAYQLARELKFALMFWIIGLIAMGWFSYYLMHKKIRGYAMMPPFSSDSDPSESPPDLISGTTELSHFSHDLCQSVIQRSPMLILKLDNALCVQAVNPTTILQTGRLEAELLGKNWLELFIPKTQHAIVQQRLDQSLSINGLLSPINSLISDELELSWTVIPYTDAQGVLSFIASGVDISELKDQLFFQEAVQHRDEPAIATPMMKSEEMEALGNMVAGIAHETNTPIGICVTNTSLLKEQASKIQQAIMEQSLTKSQMNEFLERVIEASNLMLTNLHQASELLKSFKQVAVDQTSQQGYLFNVKDNLRQIIVSLGHHLRQKSISVSVECSPHLKINSLPGRFAQIYSNLLMNSVIHAFNDINVNPSINIRITRQKQRLMIDYEDNGQGIDSSIRDHLFEPFVTTKREQGGSGLGTYIIHQIITENLSGSIEYSPREPHGTHFHIEIPIQHFEDDAFNYSD